MSDILDDILNEINADDILTGISTAELGERLKQYDSGRINAALFHLFNYKNFISQTQKGTWAINGNGIAFLEKGGFEAHEKRKAEEAGKPKESDVLNSKQFLQNFFKVTIPLLIVLFLLYYFRKKLFHH